MGVMERSGQELREEAAGGGGGLRREVGRGRVAQRGENVSNMGNVGGFGKDLAVLAEEVRGDAFREGRGQVGAIGFQEKTAVGDARGVFAGANVLGAGEGAAERNVHVMGGEGGKGIGGAGVGVEEEAGGMGGEGEKDLQHGLPGIAAVEGGGEGEFVGEVELGAEDGFAVGVETVVHAAVESDFADAGGAGGHEVAQVLEPTGGAVPDEPRMEAEGAKDETGMGVGEGGDGGPIGFAGGGDVEEGEAGGAGAGKHVGKMGGEAGILEVAMGVHPGKIFAVRRGRRCYAHQGMVKGGSISVNPQSWRGGVAAVLLALVLAGCNTFSHYPMGMEQTTLGPLKTGQKTNYQKTFDKRTEGRDGVLFAMEKGRVAQLEGDFTISRSAFEEAIAGTKSQDEKAVISASGAAAQTGAVLVNDKAIPYRAAGYERTLVHHYQALNYLAAKDLIGAGVEVRQANREQEAARQRHDGEIAKAKSKEQNVSPDEARDPHLLKVYAGLDEIAGTVKASFQNAATFYLSAVIWEMLGEANDAYIDYKKAIEIYPDHPYLQQDVLRLGRRLGMREDVEGFERRFPEAAKTSLASGAGGVGKARLVVVYEEGLVPQKSELSVPYPLSGADSIGVVALPVYEKAPPPAVPVAVRVGGKSVGQTAPICNVGALAARALAEQMPGILTRQLARSVTKGVAAQAAHDSDNGLLELGVLLFNVISEQADLRSWLTLPAHVHVLSAWGDPGLSTVTVAAPGGGALWSGKVTLAAGKTTLLVVSRADLAVYSHVFVQP